MQITGSKYNLLYDGVNKLQVCLHMRCGHIFCIACLLETRLQPGGPACLAPQYFMVCIRGALDETEQLFS